MPSKPTLQWLLACAWLLDPLSRKLYATSFLRGTSVAEWPLFRKPETGAMKVARILTKIGTRTARPWAFLIFLAYAVLWLIFDRHSLNWHGVATLATWAMTLFIQRAEHRDTQALQAKIDELIRANGAAKDDLTKIDKKEPEEIERQRAAEQN